MIENEVPEKLPDVSDLASAIEERERALVLSKRAQERQQEESREQTRDENGNVLCEDCGAIIPADRIKAVPHAVQCIGCKATNEFFDKKYV